jgi:group I intron endonuclease
MSEIIIGVYKISNAEGGRYYIGYSKDINKRFTKHKSGLKNNKHQNIFMQRAYNKYGLDEFKFEIIHKFDTVDEAKSKELEYLENMDIRKELYNLNYNNSGGDILSTHPDKEIIRKKIITSYKKTMDGMTKEERSMAYGKPGEKNGMYGKTHTTEVKEILSNTHKGNIHAKGNKWSEESKKKLSVIASERIGEKNPFFGKVHSEETRKKISENNLGKKPPNMLKVVVDDVIYDSMTQAGIQLGLNTTVVLWRIKSKNPNFDNYKYSEDNTEEAYEINKSTKIRKERKKSLVVRKKHSEESKKKMSESQKGNISSNRIKIIVDDVIYNSVAEASIKLNLNNGTLSKRLNSSDSKFDNYKYAENKKEIISSNGIKIIIDNVTYNSMTEAGIKLNLDKTTIAKRVKSDKLKFENYKYV